MQIGMRTTHLVGLIIMELRCSLCPLCDLIPLSERYEYREVKTIEFRASVWWYGMEQKLEDVIKSTIVEIREE